MRQYRCVDNHVYHIFSASTLTRCATGPSPSQIEIKVRQCSSSLLGWSMPKAPILTNTLPLISCAEGGFCEEIATTMFPNLPLLYNPGKLVSSKGSSWALVRQKGCLKYAPRLSLSCWPRPILFSSMQCSRSVLMRLISQFCLALCRTSTPGLLVQCIRLPSTCSERLYFGCGMGQIFVRSSVEGTNITSISSLILVISSFIAFITSVVSSSQVRSEYPCVRTVFFLCKIGPKTTTQSTFVFSLSRRVFTQLAKIFIPTCSLLSCAQKGPLRNKILYAWAGSLIDTALLGFSTGTQRS